MEIQPIGPQPKAGAVQVYTGGTMNGHQLGVVLQPTCVTLIKGNDHNGIDLDWEQALNIAEAIRGAAARGLRLQSGESEVDIARGVAEHSRVSDTS